MLNEQPPKALVSQGFFVSIKKKQQKQSPNQPGLVWGQIGSGWFKIKSFLHTQFNVSFYF